MNTLKLNHIYCEFFGFNTRNNIIATMEFLILDLLHNIDPFQRFKVA